MKASMDNRLREKRPAASRKPRLIFFAVFLNNSEAFQHANIERSLVMKGQMYKGETFKGSKMIVSLSPLELENGSDDLRAQSPDEQLDSALTENNLKKAIKLLNLYPETVLTRDKICRIFETIEYRTGEVEENVTPIKSSPDGTVSYPLVSKARMEMTDMYETLKKMNVLSLYGSIGKESYPVPGSKNVTPEMLETITGMRMSALTPKDSNRPLVFAGAIFAVIEGFISLYTGIPLTTLVFVTVLLTAIDRVLINGAIFESLVKGFWPEYAQKIVKHEAGHFLLAYLLGCPVEGCVLSSMDAMKDYRFGGPFTSISAGTSFFDAELSDEVNNIKPLSRASIDRFTVIVMGGIAAEAINFGRADGGAGDEMSLVRFLAQIQPRGSGAVAWNADQIKNQARWGAMQAVMLLKQYKPCYDALVDVLEREGGLGNCIYSIEKAAKDHGLPQLVLSRDHDGCNAATKNDGESALRKGLEQAEDTKSLEQEEGSDFIIASEKILSRYKKMMEEKLKDLDRNLDL